MFSGLIDAMRAAGISPADELPLHPDGKIRRFRLGGDRPRTLNGYVTIFDNGDGSYGASFGSWKHGIKETWFSGKPRHELTPAERREYARKMAAAKAEREAEEQRRHQAAAEKARHLWNEAVPASAEHPYLAKKHVKPHRLRQLNRSLVVPVHSIAGELVGLQFIEADGSKRFLSGTRIKASFHLIGERSEDTVLIAEGFATGATLHQATGFPCVCAFSAGNMRPVAEAIRAKHPTISIIICADADPVGQSAAQEAAEAVNGAWITPQHDVSET